jgi:hypothetical protein
MFKTYAGIQAGSAPAAASSGAAGLPSPGGWHPTVLYMLGLTIAEIVVVGFLSRHLLG